MKLPTIAGRSTRLAGALAAILAVSGCVVQDTPDKVAQVEETGDPLEPTNRYIFEVNLFLDEMLIKPVAWWYRIGVPDPARERIHLALANLRLPWTAVNDVLPGRDEARLRRQRPLRHQHHGGHRRPVRCRDRLGLPAA